jgi:hypothetical protein
VKSAHPTLKEKAEHELREIVLLSLYLAFFFCALVTHKMFLLREYNVKDWDFAFAVINALVVAKVILIGEYAKLGKKHENKSLFVSTLWKSLVFALLVFAFHVVEEVIKRLIHGVEIARATSEIRFDQLAARSIIVFFAFIPLFAFREFRRVMGEDEFRKPGFRGQGSSRPSRQGMTA